MTLHVRSRAAHRHFAVPGSCLGNAALEELKMQFILWSHRPQDRGARAVEAILLDTMFDLPSHEGIEEIMISRQVEPLHIHAARSSTVRPTY